jgi:hypothetical protein
VRIAKDILKKEGRPEYSEVGLSHAERVKPTDWFSDD